MMIRDDGLSREHTTHAENNLCESCTEGFIIVNAVGADLSAQRE